MTARRGASVDPLTADRPRHPTLIAPMPADDERTRSVRTKPVTGVMRGRPLGSTPAWALRERQLHDLAAQTATLTFVGASIEAADAGDLARPATTELQHGLVQAAREQLGCVPHTRCRRVGVTPEHHGLALGEFLTRRFPHVPVDRWVHSCSLGSLTLDQRAVDLSRPVHAGALFEHRELGFREPAVATELRVLWADHAMWVVDKPAPLPVHPCGRYGHNTFTSIAQRAVAALPPWVLAELERDRDELRRDAFADEIAARPVHRLDADTRGLLVVARSRAAARALTRQWEHREVLKLYRATVYGDARGIDGWWEGAIGLPAAGRVREIIARAPDALGHDALTYARAVGSDDEFRTTTVLLSPWSGRTNQLRVHLAAMGFPIVGDDDHDRGPAGGAEGVTSRAVESGRALALAATHLELTHPFDGRRLRFALP